MNATQSTTTRCFVNDSAAIKSLRLASYGVLILVSLLGNSFVVTIVYRHKKLRKNINLFISNMAVADLITTAIYMPRLMVMYEIGATWIGGTFGLVLCKIIPFLHGVSLLVSILTLLLISIERFCAILFPLKFIFNSKKTKIAIALTWMGALLARVPYFLALRTRISPSGRIHCSSRLANVFTIDQARDIYYTTLLIGFYALPLVLIIVSYLVIIVYLRRSHAPGSKLTSKQLDGRRIRAIRNVVRMMIVVTAAFIACWITYFVTPLTFAKTPCALRFWRFFLAHSNSALNPCLYVLFDRQFRRAFVQIFAGNLAARQRQNSSSRIRSENREISANYEANAPRRQPLSKMTKAVQDTTNVKVNDDSKMQISITTRL